MTKNNSSKPKKTSPKKSSKGRKGGKLSQVSSVILLVALVVFIAAYLYSNYTMSHPAPAPVQKESTIKMPAEKSTKKAEKKKKSTNKKEEKKTKKTTDNSQRTTETAEVKKEASVAPVSLPVASLSSLSAERDLRPAIEFEFNSQVIEHKGYIVSYNADYKVPNWVLYELTLGETLGNLKRADAFGVDPEVPEKQMAQLTDYRNSGYDRGHMAPNADLNWDKQAQKESYYLSNMCPQTHEFNAGIWLDLENKVREWAERDSAITIVCGPVLPKDAAQAKKMSRIGKGHVLVPEYFYKVILSPYGKDAKAIAFLMPHDIEKGGRKPLEKYAVTVDDIEALTGLDFFPALPDKVEDKLEGSFALSKWFVEK